MSIIVLEEQRQVAMIERVLELEADVRKLPPVELKYRHHYARGLYAREMFIPTGTMVTGKIHKYENLNVMSAGELTVLTHEGPKRVRAPFTIVSPAGTKRIAFAHEDTVWTTIHPTDERDLEKIERLFTADTLEDFLAFRAEQIAERDLWKTLE